MRLRNCLLAILILFFTENLRIHRCPAQTPTTSIPPAILKLRSDLEANFSDPRLAQAQICVKVMSLDRQEVLYEKNARQLFTPASTNKLITAAVALVRMGPDYKFETRAFTDGQIHDGVLEGNLIIVGSGDPSCSPRFHDGDAFAVFKNWAAALKEKGIRTISGMILGDDSAFNAPGLGFGWEWNDLPRSYAARACALQFNDNVISLRIAPGPDRASPAIIRALPLEDYLAINNRIMTESGPGGAEPQIEYLDSDESIRATGSIPIKSEPMVQSVAVQHPTRFFLAAVESALSKEGIHANKSGLAIPGNYSAPPYSLLWSTYSPPLPDILKPLLKKSQNLYAETLVRALGLTQKGEGSFAKGREVVEEALAEMEIPTGSYVYADGSGLSRQNLESADSLVQLLRSMRQQKNFEIFYDSLPIAGTDGTLSDRMKKSRTKNNVHAKTGSMANVSTISGYVKTADGEMLAFSISVNNSMAAKDIVETLQDKAIEKLAEFARSPN